MPKLVSAQDLDRLVELIGQYPDGIGIDRLSQAMAMVMSRRTLQRRLATLVEQMRVKLEGEGRAIKYRISPVNGVSVIAEAADIVQANSEVYVPTSPEGAEIRAYIRQPRQQRQPVSYKVEFLERYHPNLTYYLPESLRAQLHLLGRSSASQQRAGTFARDILNRLMIDLSWASSRLEGNTYSRLDTERLIEFGQAAEGKDALETQMILNHKAAIEYLVRDTEHAGVNAETIVALHAFLSDGLLPDPLACGRIRNHPVDIGGSVYLPIAMPQRLEELFGIVVIMASEIRDPFEQAFFLMVHLPYLQPFEDVNKRVSRLAANIPFIRHNLCPLSFIDVPQQAYVDGVLGVYELTRIELLRDVFVWAYERSCQQYVAVQQHLVPPDTFRLRYRNSLTEAVVAVVRGGMPVSEGSIRTTIPATVAENDRERFVELVLTEFKGLHAGNAIRFGLRPLEYAQWQEGTRQEGSTESLGG
ncbi:Fic family protein [Methylococcus sp. EFPC2]|uniref:Fic family protein n=1 Tax=Methylococcus sp. EFPC2 TaxID=2812648 RepID=UPI0019687E66|nr:Fic family protein [Methylococcus sp. EFPC2]QSA95813.1 Fic family protein [Methylococcus sp. EFPC2]